MGDGTSVIPCDIRDLALADAGKRQIEWAFQAMPVLQAIRKQFIKNQPLAGMGVAARLHVTPETANLLITLRDGGARPSLCACSPLSTHDDVAASLVRDYHIPVFASSEETPEEAFDHAGAVLDLQPNVVIGHGAELTLQLHRNRREQVRGILGATDETAAGVSRCRGLEQQGALGYPVLAVAESGVKRLFDNRYGTAQSTLDGIVRATHIPLSGATVVVAGYGWCGRGIAALARSMGASAIVTEVDPLKAIEAVMDGHRVMPMTDAAAAGDVFITVTGNKQVLGRDHFDRMKDGAILCNAGRADIEIDLDALARAAPTHRKVRDSVEEFRTRDGRRIYLLGGGGPINFVAAEGHPPGVMDLCFACHALAVEYLVQHRGEFAPGVHPVPEAVDREAARLKLEVMRIVVDRLTVSQEQYLTNAADAV